MMGERESAKEEREGQLVDAMRRAMRRRRLTEVLDEFASDSPSAVWSRV
jgi:hypothetical protein